jgi:hypothetical protein
MKSCPICNRTFEDSFSFCLVDGAVLSAPYDPQATLALPHSQRTEPPPTEILPSSTQPFDRQRSSRIPISGAIQQQQQRQHASHFWLIGVAGFLLIVGAAIALSAGLWLSKSNPKATTTEVDSEKRNKAVTSNATPQSTRSPASSSVAERLGIVGLWRRDDGSKIEVNKNGEAIFLEVSKRLAALGFSNGDTHFTNLRLEGNSIVMDAWLRMILSECPNSIPKMVKGSIQIKSDGDSLIVTLPLLFRNSCQWTDKVSGNQVNTWTRINS